MAGTPLHCLGDGFCWLYALGASIEQLENADSPTARDFRWLGELLRKAQEHAKSTVRSTDLGARLAKGTLWTRFLALKAPHRDVELDETNYGGTAVAYPVLASFLQMGILCISGPILEGPPDFELGRKSKRGKVQAGTPLHHFTYFVPGAEFEQNLSLEGTKLLLEETDKSVAIVVHNGGEGACSYHHMQHLSTCQDGVGTSQHIYVTNSISQHIVYEKNSFQQIVTRTITSQHIRHLRRHISAHTYYK